MWDEVLPHPLKPPSRKSYFLYSYTLRPPRRDVEVAFSSENVYTLAKNQLITKTLRNATNV